MLQYPGRHFVTCALLVYPSSLPPTKLTHRDDPPACCKYLRPGPHGPRLLQCHHRPGSLRHDSPALQLLSYHFFRFPDCDRRRHSGSGSGWHELEFGAHSTDEYVERVRHGIDYGVEHGDNFDHHGNAVELGNAVQEWRVEEPGECMGGGNDRGDRQLRDTGIWNPAIVTPKPSQIPSHRNFSLPISRNSAVTAFLQISTNSVHPNGCNLGSLSTNRSAADSTSSRKQKQFSPRSFSLWSLSLIMEMIRTQLTYTSKSLILATGKGPVKLVRAAFRRR